MALSLSIHGSPTVDVYAASEGDIVWVTGHELTQTATIFLTRDQALRVHRVLDKYLGIKSLPPGQSSIPCPPSAAVEECKQHCQSSAKP